MDTDIRHVLPAIRVPTLVLYQRTTEIMAASSRRGSLRLAPSRSRGRASSLGAPPELFDEIERFLVDLGKPPRPDRVLATILFTDIVDSTPQSRKNSAMPTSAGAAQSGITRLIRGLLALYNGVGSSTPLGTVSSRVI